MGAHNAFYDQYSELLSAMHADVFALNKTFPVASDLQHVLSRVACEGGAFIYGSLPLLGRAMDAALACGHFSCPAVFARKKGTSLPRLYYRGFSLVFRDDGTLRADCAPATIQSIRQLLLIDSKAERPFSREQLHAFESRYREQQRSLRKVVLPVGMPELSIVQTILAKALDRVPQTFDLMPNHGPGATAEGYTMVEKWSFPSWPKRLERFFPFSRFGCLNLYEHLRAGRAIRLTRKSITKACFVPKDFRGPRLISVEPAAMQYAQQAMRHWLENKIATSLTTRRSIFIDDQSRNQERASRAYSYDDATVDLSSASDTLSAVAVWHFLAKVPHVRRRLFSLRSDAVGFPSGPERLVSFAPMGSAICFPVESIVFFAIATAVVMETMKLGFFRASSLVRCYGDDIILPASCVDRLFTVLTSIGCEPNRNKTCYATPFRESCGKEFFRDEDVTIVRNKLYAYGDNRIQMHPVLRALQREFFLKGYRRTAEVLVSWIDAIFPSAMIPPGTFRDTEPFVFGDKRLIKSPIRWNSDLQFYETQVPVFQQRTRAWPALASEYGLRAALIASSYLERFAVRYRKVTKIAWRNAGSTERKIQ